MTTEDVDTITLQTIINIRPTVVAALKEFFGLSQLSQFGPDELALEPHASPAPLGARRRRA